MYGFAPYDSWEDYVDFNNTGYTNREKYEQDSLANPITPPHANLPDTAIQYHYDGDERLATTFIGVQGDAAIRHLSSAGNPSIQQVRSAP